MEESLAVIRKAWSEQTVTYKGKYFHIPGVVINPKPVQNPIPPFYMATSSLEGVEVGARLGINLFLPIHTRTPEQVVEFATAYWYGLATHNHERKGKELGLLVPMHLASNTQLARARSQEGIMSYFETIAAMRRDYINWLTDRGESLPPRLGTAAPKVPSFETVCAHHAVVGDSESAIAAIKGLAEKTAAAHFLLWMNIGNVPHTAVIESMQQFASEVMPRL
jgi:alkanesulfonate monooxygenase SsuD/methylene tetrahydromethanopterin reductase-like flavin-dependent oxidoreductase (luciferase family)